MSRCRLIFLFLVLAASAIINTEADKNVTNILRSRYRSPIIRRVSMDHCTKALHLIISSKNIDTDGQQVHTTHYISTFVLFDLVPKPLEQDNLQNIGNKVGQHDDQRPAGVKSYKLCYRVQIPVLTVLLKKLQIRPCYIHKTIHAIEDNEVINDQSNVKNNIGRVDKSKPLDSEEISPTSQKKQPDHRGNSAVTEISREKPTAHEFARTKRCVGKECEKGVDNGCDGLSPQICKDIAEVANWNEADKKKKKSAGNKDANVPLIIFESKEIVGLIMILVVAGFLIYLNVFHGNNEYARTFMTFGTLTLFLLFATVAVQLFSRSTVSGQY